MTHLVYPGALHSRFHHALGAMHLMSLALKTLSDKGQSLSSQEEEAVMIAILLHDIGHGPFSHALEKHIVQGIDHEDISTLLMTRLNSVFKGRLTMAIEIFNNRYHKKFLHQLVSSQLDMDRLDYLNRDSFYTGVSEGVISSERIIKMLNVVDDAMVVEEKGIYSIEKFLVARRLMYWQVYLHKTVTSGEQMLGKILKRARQLSLKGEQLFSTPALNHFLQKNISKEQFINEDHHIETFTCLDDTDIMAAVKVWTRHTDKVLALLCENFIQRKLYHVDITNAKPDAAKVEELRQTAMKKYDLCFEDAGYFVFTDIISNNAYKVGDANIKILMKGGTISDITTASDNSNLEALAKTVEKYIFCYTKDLI
jgi:HD superfamily phosphohydrolase